MNNQQMLSPDNSIIATELVCARKSANCNADALLNYDKKQDIEFYKSCTEKSPDAYVRENLATF
jgi:hypothetical protein